MFAQSLRRSILETRCALPPTFLLPMRASITTVSHSLETGNVPDQLVQSGQHISKDLKEKIQNQASVNTSIPPSSSIKPTPNAREDITSTGLTPSIQRLLPLLHSQSSHYLTIHIHGHPYLITEGDEVRLPFLMPNVGPGDILRLNRATHIGSRDYTLKAPEPQRGTRDAVKKTFYLDDRLFTCRATVVGVESEPMRFIEKTKRRQRHVRTVKSKHRYTVLKISEVKVKSLDEYEKSLKTQ
ncbi:hypothetical protein BU24DRAFT_424258 [Aaosphaeria arxii CBS 175.79]|uniref:Large ribosomal subunit protein bL21m n=1 Tax=Aaosphaeria arxii CBS 175.79 TaxID=1450172 RepID=A0A6A5XJ03_9PLEO|nr:uncharacterized protein BU24DRAFT_424258 [Aaosphaeria arxii CBS 175.79]KAF2013255.1 hypothetical protein BU24DRAFT_424258 [Aaosphaeria arxii CBS 175.79]